MTEEQQEIAVRNIRASIPILQRIEIAINDGKCDPERDWQGNPVGPTRTEQISQISSLLKSSKSFIKEIDG